MVNNFFKILPALDLLWVSTLAFENLGDMKSKQCKLILLNVHLLDLHDILILQILLQRIKIHSNMLCQKRKEVVLWFFKFWIFALCNLLSELNGRVAFISQIFLQFGQFYFCK